MRSAEARKEEKHSKNTEQPEKPICKRTEERSLALLERQIRQEIKEKKALENDEEVLFFFCEEGKWNSLLEWFQLNTNNVAHLKTAATSFRRWDRRKEMPLHVILSKFELPPVEVIEAFIKYTPEVLQIQTEEGMLPIHFALQYYKSTTVVQLLLEAYPDGLRVAARDGRIPLHKAIYYRAPLEVLNLLVEAYPESVNEKSSQKELMKWKWETGKDGEELSKFLLHRVCSGGYSNHLAKLVLETYPTSIRQRDYSGMVPLHHACANAGNNGYSFHVINLLIQADPKSTDVKDNKGTTPLQYLKETASRVDKRGMLLLHREATNIRELHVEMLPINRLLYLDCCLFIMQA